MKFFLYLISGALVMTIFLQHDAHAQTDLYDAAKNAGSQAVERSSSDILQDFFSIFSGGSLGDLDSAPLNPSSNNDQSPPSGGEDIYGPLPLNSQVASTAQKIASKVKESCTQFPDHRGGIVRAPNASCVDPVASVVGDPVGTSVVTEMKFSARMYENLQCVGCVVAFAKITKPYSAWGNAKDYLGMEIAGYKYVPGNKTSKDKSYFKQIKPGSFFIIDKWVFGHIGIVTDIVTDVNGVPHSFRAFECNYGAKGLLRHDLTWSFLEVDGFQVPL